MILTHLVMFKFWTGAGNSGTTTFPQILYMALEPMSGNMTSPTMIKLD